jgi:hypothetical protein
MSATFPQAYVYEFSSNVFHLGQQKESRLMPVANVKYGTGTRFHWERLAASEMVEKTTQLAVTPVVDAAHSKRYAAMATWSWGEAIEPNEAAQALIDPRSEYTRAAAMAYGRRIDTIILNAAIAAAGTGLGGSSTQALTAGQQIGGTGGATGAGQKLTVAGLRQAKRLMDAAEVSEKRWFITDSKGLQDLLAVTEVVSADYNTVRALVMGELDTFLGFKFIRSERIPVNTGNRKWNLAIAENAIGLGFASERMARVAEDPSRSFALRVYLETVLGAVRIEEAGVVALDVDSTA